MPHSRYWLCLPPVALALVDAVLTLAGQPAAYWAGDFVARNELNPVFDVLLMSHPLAFIAGAAVWVLAGFLAITSVSKDWAVRLSYLFSFAHAVGAAAWLIHMGLAGWLLAAALLATAQRFVYDAVVRSGGAGAA